MLKTLIAAAALIAVAGSALAAPPPPPPAHATAPAGKLTVDSRLSDLLANPATRPVMDRHLPNLSDNPHYAMIQGMTLREIAPRAGDKLNDAGLAKINAELLAAQK